MHLDARRILCEGLAGFAGTLLMTVVMIAGRALQLMWVLPPREITARAEERIGIRQDLSQPEFDASWILAHLGYGSAGGVIYALVRRFLPSSPILAGLTFGLALWAFGYLGIMPALGLYPWPADNSRTRRLTMIVAHAVFGLTTAEVERRLPRAGRATAQVG